MEPRSLCACIFGVFLLSVEAQVKLDLKDGNNSEVIFEGEDVPMVCLFSSDRNENVSFIVYLNDTTILMDDRVKPNNIGLVVTDITKTDKQIEFVLQSVRIEHAGQYKCEVIDMLQQNSFNLTIYPTESVQCRQNNSDMYIAMESLKISCYFTSLSSDNSFRWIKRRNGSSCVISSNLEDIGSGDKRKLTATINPSDDFSPVTYSCESSGQHGRICTTGPYVVYSVFTPIISTLAPGDEVIITCRHPTIGGVAAISVFTNFGSSIGSIITQSDSDTLNITAPPDAAIGSYIYASCSVFVGENRALYGLNITVQRINTTVFTGARPSTEISGSSDIPSTMRGNKPGTNEDEGISTIVIIVIGSVSVVTLIGIIVAILCMVHICGCLTKTAHGSDSSDIYAKVYSIRRRSNVQKNSDKHSNIDHNKFAEDEQSQLHSLPPHRYDNMDDRHHEFAGNEPGSPKCGHDSTPHEEQMSDHLGGHEGTSEIMYPGYEVQMNDHFGGNEVGSDIINPGYDDDEEESEQDFEERMSVEYSEVNKNIDLY